MAKKILIGNSFSLSLVRGAGVDIAPSSIDALKKLLGQGVEVVSFWGHENTRAAAERILGVSLKPAVERPALRLSGPSDLPTLYGLIFDTCWVLSPDYATGYRPRIGEETDESKITGWQLLKLTWKHEGSNYGGK